MCLANGAREGRYGDGPRSSLQVSCVSLDKNDRGEVTLIAERAARGGQAELPGEPFHVAMCSVPPVSPPMHATPGVQDLMGAQAGVCEAFQRFENELRSIEQALAGVERAAGVVVADIDSDSALASQSASASDLTPGGAASPGGVTESQNRVPQFCPARYVAASSLGPD